eukprot:GHVL01014367.1.p1 GENE.GHVL01014367.1~~GHVL01014367.1.p1  ORF type:complete len:2794 (-),score=468.51 GHVL01014367.1:122-8503(-)
MKTFLSLITFIFFLIRHVISSQNPTPDTPPPEGGYDFSCTKAPCNIQLDRYTHGLRKNNLIMVVKPDCQSNVTDDLRHRRQFVEHDRNLNMYIFDNFKLAPNSGTFAKLCWCRDRSTDISLCTDMVGDVFIALNMYRTIECSRYNTCHIDWVGTGVSNRFPNITGSKIILVNRPNCDIEDTREVIMMFNIENENLQFVIPAPKGVYPIQFLSVCWCYNKLCGDGGDNIEDYSNFNYSISEIIFNDLSSPMNVECYQAPCIFDTEVLYNSDRRVVLGNADCTVFSEGHFSPTELPNGFSRFDLGAALIPSNIPTTVCLCQTETSECPLRLAIIKTNNYPENIDLYIYDDNDTTTTISYLNTSKIFQFQRTSFSAIILKSVNCGNVTSAEQVVYCKTPTEVCSTVPMPNGDLIEYTFPVLLDFENYSVCLCRSDCTLGAEFDSTEINEKYDLSTSTVLVRPSKSKDLLNCVIGCEFRIGRGVIPGNSLGVFNSPTCEGLDASNLIGDVLYGSSDGDGDYIYDISLSTPYISAKLCFCAYDCGSSSIPNYIKYDYEIAIGRFNHINQTLIMCNNSQVIHGECLVNFDFQPSLSDSVVIMRETCSTATVHDVAAHLLVDSTQSNFSVTIPPTLAADYYYICLCNNNILCIDKSLTNSLLNIHYQTLIDTLVIKTDFLYFSCPNATCVVSMGLPVNPESRVYLSYDSQCPTPTDAVFSPSGETEYSILISSTDPIYGILCWCPVDCDNQLYYNIGNVGLSLPTYRNFDCFSDELCRLSYTSFEYVYPESYDSIIIVAGKDSCTTFSDMTDVVSWSKVEDPRDFIFEMIPSMVYSICFCFSSTKDCDDPRVVLDINIAKLEYSDFIGILTVLPSKPIFPIDCTTGSCIYDGVNVSPMNKVLIINTHDCLNIDPSINILHPMVDPSESTFHFTNFRNGGYMGTMCWCPQECGLTVPNYNNYTNKSGPIFVAKPNIKYFDYYIDDNDSNEIPLIYTKDEYNVSYSPEDSVTIFQGDICNTQEIFPKTKFVQLPYGDVRVFIEKSDFLLPGTYSICWCYFSEAYICSNTNSFNIFIGLLRIAPIKYDKKECLGSACSIRVDPYREVDTNDAAIIVRGVDCGTSPLVHNEVQILNSVLFTFDNFLESATANQYTMCWCSKCYNTNQNRHIYTPLVDVIRRYSVPPTSEFEHFDCYAGQDCDIYFSANPDEHPNDRLLVRPSEEACGSPTTDPNVRYSRVISNAAQFPKFDVDVGGYNICWCSGLKTSCTIIINFNTFVGVIQQLPLPYEYEQDCLHSCVVGPDNYPNPLPGDTAMIVRKANCINIVYSDIEHQPVPVQNGQFQFNAFYRDGVDSPYSVCYCQNCLSQGVNEDINQIFEDYSRYQRKIASLNRFEMPEMPTLVSGLICVAGEACEIELPRYVGIDKADSIIVVDGTCGSLLYMTDFARYAKITPSSIIGKPHFSLNLNTIIPVPTGIYQICFCKNNHSTNECSYNNIHDINMNFPLHVGYLRKYPIFRKRIFDCSLGTCMISPDKREDYPVKDQTDYALLVLGTGCTSESKPIIGAIQVSPLGEFSVNLRTTTQTTNNIPGPVTICLCLGCGEDTTTVSKYMYPIGTLYRSTLVEPYFASHECLAGDTCDLQYPTYAANPNDKALMTTQECGTIAEMQNVIGPVPVDLSNDTTAVFTFRNIENIGYYNICWCNGSNNICPLNPTLDDINNMYINTIGDLYRKPKSRDGLIECFTNDCSLKLDSYSVPNDESTAIVVVGRSCDNLSAIVHAPVKAVQSEFIFAHFNQPAETGEYSVCWKFVISESSSTKSLLKTTETLLKIGRIVRAPTIIPKQQNSVCIASEECYMNYQPYEDLNINDKVVLVQTKTGCRRLVSSDTLALTVPVVPLADPRFMVDSIVPLGIYHICFCSGNEGDCNLPMNIHESNLEYIHFIGELHIIPKELLNFVDCSSGTCSVTPETYPQPLNTNQAIILRGHGCEGHEVVHSSVFPNTETGTFEFSQFSIKSYGTVCWCYEDCNGSSMNFIHAIAHVTFNLEDNPANLVLCEAGKGSCLVELYPYTNIDHGDKAIMVSTTDCSMLTDITQVVAFSDLNYDNFMPKFEFEFDGLVGKYSVCWCSGSDDMKTCTDDTLNNFATKIGDILYHPSVTTSPIDCLSRACSLTPSEMTVITIPIKPLGGVFYFVNLMPTTTDRYNIYWCYQCDEINYTEYYVLIGIADIINTNVDCNIQKDDYICETGAPCELKLPYFSLSRYNDALILVVSSSHCGVITGSISDHSKVSMFASQPTYQINSNLPNNIYRICWCSSNTSLCKSTKPSMEVANEMYNNDIGYLTISPRSQYDPISCVITPCVVTPNNYPNPSPDNVAFVANTSCDTAHELLHTETPPTGQTFVFAAFSTKPEGVYPVCWKYNIGSQKSIKIGEVILGIPDYPYKKDYICTAGDIYCILYLSSTYTLFNPMDMVMTVKTTNECGKLLEGDIITGFSTVTLLEGGVTYFLHDPLDEYMVGSYKVCFCGGIPCHRGSIYDINYLFTADIGNLLYLPKPSLSTVDCSSGTCSLQPALYPSTGATDMTNMAIVVQNESCNNLDTSMIIHDRISELSGEFIFTKFTDELSDRSTKLACWCPRDCTYIVVNHGLEEVVTNVMNFIIFIGEVTRVNRNPHEIGTIRCTTGVNNCPLITMQPYLSQNKGDMMLLVASTETCGRLVEGTEITNVVRIDLSDLLEPKFLFFNQSEISSGNYILCRCDGSYGSCDIEGILDRVTFANDRYPYHVGDVIRQRPSTSVLQCNSAGCILSPSS